MKKLLCYLVIRLTTRHAETAVKIYEKIYHNENDRPIINTYTQSSETNNLTSVSKTTSKKQELLDSLNYLKSKSVKTKQDKESIYSLEMVLKNM